MSEIQKLLETPLRFDQLPHLFNQGGKDYMQGYESCRNKCLIQFRQQGHIEGIAPLMRRPGIETQTPKDKLFVEGHNRLLIKAHKLTED